MIHSEGIYRVWAHSEEWRSEVVEVEVKERMEEEKLEGRRTAQRRVVHGVIHGGCHGVMVSWCHGVMVSCLW